MKEKQDRPVKGHMCPGLDRFQNRVNYNMELEPGCSCIPIFDADGCCIGCDDTNRADIQYCPFCGVKL